MALEKWIYEKLTAHMQINENDSDLLQHGIETFVSDLSCMAGALVLAAVTGNMWEAVLYITVFSILRTYTGGWHAESRLLCFLSYIGVFALFLITLRISIDPWLMTAMFAICSIITFYLAPVEHEYNPLSEKELLRNRSRSRIVITLLAITYVIFFMIKWYISKVLFSIILLNTLLMLALRFSRHWRYYDSSQMCSRR